MLNTLYFFWMQILLGVVSTLVAILPRIFLPYIGALMGALLHHFWTKRRSIVERNIALCFPMMPLRHQARLERSVFASLAQGLLEAMVAWQGRAQALLKDAEVYGDHYLEEALATDKGVLLLSPHFSSLELLGAWVDARMAKAQVPSAGVYYPQKNQGFDQWVVGKRALHYKNSVMFKDSEFRSMVRWLKEGNALVMYPDADLGADRSVFADFFGIAAATVPVAPKMMRLTDCQVLTISLVRVGRRYRVDITPAMNHLMVGNDQLDTRTMNRLFEERIAQYPEQYHWVHRRFKSRPDGESSVYE